VVCMVEQELDGGLQEEREEGRWFESVFGAVEGIQEREEHWGGRVRDLASPAEGGL
jgi:hypothetical protein